MTQRPQGPAFFRFSNAKIRAPEVQAWLGADHDELRRLAGRWFAVMRDCGADVHELMHDGCPTACVGDVAFAYVGAFKAHINVGFFNGAPLADPARLLEGTGKRMRHVKVRWGQPVDEDALSALIHAAYRDMRDRLAD